MIRILKNEKEMIFGLDTGANRTQFGKKMKNNFNDLKKVKRTIIGAGALIDEELFEANEFEFNIKNSKVTLQNIAIYDKDHSSSNFFVTPGIFGSDIFVGKKVVIDYPNRSLELED
jgi:acetyltransferase-like isoleucine patch superfamily enzyme